MDLELSPEQRALQEELRAYFAAMMTPSCCTRSRAARAAGRCTAWRSKQMGRDGWLGISWPKEYGGQGRSPHRAVHLRRRDPARGFPLPFLTLNTIGPTLMQVRQRGADGSDFLPRILAGEMSLLRRLLRAGRGHRPRVAEDQAPCATATSG